MRALANALVNEWYQNGEKLESRKDELEIAIKDLDETYEQELDSHQDIRVYIEEKVIKKEDEVDYMIDREEVILIFQNCIFWLSALGIIFK